MCFYVLNLPEQVTGNATVSYVYDAAGNKLSKTVSETGQSQKVTTYLGNLIFENNVLQHVATEEGRARLESGIWKFDYFLKDHLGNVRMMLADNGTVLEETHYYPFGLIQRGISYQNTSVPENKKKFNGIEQTKELGLNQYDAFFRTMDPQLGRWWQIDSKPTHSESLYAIMGNNPIRNTDPLGDTLRGVDKQDARRLSREIKRSLRDAGTGAMAKLIRRSGNTFKNINENRFAKVTSKMSSDQKALANGYKKIINSEKTHVVEVVKRKESLSPLAVTTFDAYEGAKGSFFDKFGGGINKGTPTGTFTAITTDYSSSNGSYIDVLTGKEVFRSDALGERLAHELIGHGLGKDIGSQTQQNIDAIQMSNLYLRLTGSGRYYRDGRDHYGQIKERVIATGIPEYLED